LELAGPVLDLYACQWQGQPLWADDYVLSADEKTSIQVPRRCHPSLPIGPYQAMRVEHEYERGCAAVPGGLGCPSRRGLRAMRVNDRQAVVGRLVDDVMDQEPYHSARRVFWIVGNGSSHRGQRAAEGAPRASPADRHPRHADTRQLAQSDRSEIYFSIIQRKVRTPNDCTSLQELEDPIVKFGRRYSVLGKPFSWCFTRHDLEGRLREPLLQSEAVTLTNAA
jgi:hypothetical protein